MALLTWHYITSTVYNNASDTEKTDEKIFFLSDTGEIYRGKKLFTESVILYTEEPTVKAVGKLYVNSTTLEGKVWNGSAWTTVIKPVQATLSTTDTSNPVSGKAVADHVASEIAKINASGDIVKNVTYTSSTNTLVVAKADGTSSNVPLTNVAADLVYDTATGKLQVKNASGTAIGTGVNLDLERFVQSASYADGKITLVFNDESDPIEIDVGDLIDTYTAGNTTSVALTLTGNKFTADVIVAETAGNMLQSTDTGLYVAATDISGKVDKVSNATADAIATLTADGNIKNSNVKIGGATLAATPNATTLATEAGVNAIRTALNTSISGKMTKVATGHAGELITANADGDAALSGIKTGGAAFKATPDSTTLATEAGAAAFVKGYGIAKTDIVAKGNLATEVADASDSKVPSEKAIIDALTWKTTI